MAKRSWSLFDFWQFRKGRERMLPVDPQIQANLEEACKRHLPADLSIGGDPSTFGARFVIHFVAVDHTPAGRCLFIEPLIPRRGNADLQRSRSLLLEYQLGDRINYSFRSRFLGLVQERSTLLKIAYPVSIESAQRRQFFRISSPSEESVKFFLEIDFGLGLQGKVLDISEGGFSFLTYQGHLQAGLPTKVRLELPEGETIQAEAIIRTIRPEPYRDPGLPQYRCGVEFQGISEAIQRKILQYVRKKQLEELRRKRNQE